MLEFHDRKVFIVVFGCITLHLGISRIFVQAFDFPFVNSSLVAKAIIFLNVP